MTVSNTLLDNYNSLDTLDNSYVSVSNSGIGSNNIGINSINITSGGSGGAGSGVIYTGTGTTSGTYISTGIGGGYGITSIPNTVGTTTVYPYGYQQTPYHFDYTSRINAEIGALLVDFVTRYGTEKLKKILDDELVEDKLREENESLEKLHRQYKVLAKMVKNEENKK